MFAFVEGRLDRPFFDRILAHECKSKQLEHRVIAMKELPGGTGGKATLIATFQQFRKSGLLACNAFGKSMACIFLADKDADDFTRRKLRSPHFIYSPTYDLEGHLFESGDFTRALADSCGITMEQSKIFIPDPKNWLETVVSNWKDWIALCLISQANSINCGCTFDRPSAVNPDPLAQPDQNQVEAFKTNLGQMLQISQISLNLTFNLARQSIERSIISGRPLRYFKGKWLSHLVQRFLESQPRIPEALISGVGERLAVCFLGQIALGTSCRFSSAYSPHIQRIVARV